MIKFKKVNGWTLKTEDNQYMIYNGGPNEWYSAKIDPEMIEKYGYCSVAVDESSKMFHYSIKDAQSWVREVLYKVGA